MKKALVKFSYTLSVFMLRVNALELASRVWRGCLPVDAVEQVIPYRDRLLLP